MVGDERATGADDAGGVRYVRRNDGSVTHSEAPRVPIDAARSKGVGSRRCPIAPSQEAAPTVLRRGSLAS
jgi:hypothetical protein